MRFKLTAAVLVAVSLSPAVLELPYGERRVSCPDEVGYGGALFGPVIGPHCTFSSVAGAGVMGTMMAVCCR